MPNFDESLLKPEFNEALLKPERRSGVLSEFGMSEEPSKEELAGASEWLTSPLLKIKPPTPEEAAGLMSPIGFPIRRVPRPPGPTPPAVDVGLGLLESDIGAVAGLTAPMNIAMAPAMGVPGVAPVAGAVFGGQALGSGLGELSVAIPQGDPRAIGRGVGSVILGGALGAAGVKGGLATVALPRAAEALAEEPGAEPPATAAEPAPAIVPPEPVQPALSEGAQPVEVPDALSQRKTEAVPFRELPRDRPQVDPQIRLGAQGEAPAAETEVPSKAEDVTAGAAKPPEPAPAEPAAKPNPKPSANIPTEIQNAADVWRKAEKSWRRAMRQGTPDERTAAEEAKTEAELVFRSVAEKTKMSDKAYERLVSYARETETERPVPADAPTPPAEAQSKAQAEVSRVARTEGVRSAKEIKADLVEKLTQAWSEAPDEYDTAKPTVKITIPDDGEFTLSNTTAAIESVLKRAKRIQTTTEAKAFFPKGAVESSSRAIAQGAVEAPELARRRAAQERVEAERSAAEQVRQPEPAQATPAAEAVPAHVMAYHGTKAKAPFETFGTKWVFSTSSAENAGSYGRVMKVAVKSQKPVVYDAKGKAFEDVPWDDLQKQYKESGADSIRVDNVIDSGSNRPQDRKPATVWVTPTEGTKPHVESTAQTTDPTIPVLGLREADSTPMALGKLRKSDPARHADILRFFGVKTSAQAAKAAALRFAEIRNAPPPGSSVHLQGPDLPTGPRPFGIVAPSSLPFHNLVQALSEPISSATSWMRELWRGFAMKQAPKLTDADRPTGEAAVRYASSYLVAKAKGLQFSRQVLEGTGIPEHKFGVALSEDNLRGVRDGLIAAGKPDEAANVVTLIGRPHSPFATEAEYQAFLTDPATQLAVQRHKQLWVEQKDPLFRQANDLDPDAPLASRGRQTGARVNLKALLADDPGVRAVGRPGLPGFRQLASLKRRDPFAQRAKGTGAVYEGSYDALMANSFEREMPIAAQHEFIRSLIDSGNAIVKDKEFEKGLELRGEATTGRLMRLNPWRGKFLHIRRSLLDEYDAISGLDKPATIPVLTTFNRWLTRMSIQGLAEGSTHAANLLNEAFTGLGPTSHPLINALLKSLGRVDLLYRIPSVVIRGFSEAKTRPEMISLMERGAAKQPYKRGFLGVGAVLNAVDRGARLTAESIYKGMAKEGWVEDTETGVREFVNQVGNYNKRLQPRLIRALRDTGIQPFATAGQTFNVLGLRRMVFAPGAKAASNGAALALRADIAAGWLGAAVLVTVLNKLVSGTATGPKGTPLGAVGWVGDDGKVHSLNIGRLMGFSRGLEHTGIKPAIEAARVGLPPSEQVRAATDALTSTALSTVMGPGPRALWTSFTGKRPTQPGVQAAPIAPPTDDFAPFKTQFAKNVETAAIEANPIVGTFADLYQGKSLPETLGRQFRRYTPVPGRTEQFTERLPAILTRKRIVEYADSLATETRRKPIHDRLEFVQKRFESDDLDPRYRRDVIVEMKRRGVFKYE